MATPPDFSSGAVLTAAQMDKIGLWRVDQKTATSGSNIQITGCFTTDFVNYLLLLDNVATAADAGIHVSMLVGTTNNAANWTWGAARSDYSAGTYTYNKATADSLGPQILVAGTAGVASGRVEIFRPKLASRTNLLSMGTDARTTTGYLPISTGGVLANSTQYDGVQVTVSGSTFTSITATVYGYN